MLRPSRWIEKVDLDINIIAFNADGEVVAKVNYAARDAPGIHLSEDRSSGAKVGRWGGIPRGGTGTLWGGTLRVNGQRGCWAVQPFCLLFSSSTSYRALMARSTSITLTLLHC
jgi:hypothetical protein